MISQHWHPLSNKGGEGDDNDDSDNDVEDEGDKAFKEFNKVSAFANPVQSRKKKGLDFRKWKEITQDDNSSLGKGSEEDMSRFIRTTGKKKNEKGSRSADNKKTSPSADDSAFASMKVDAKQELDNLDGVFFNSATDMELDTSNKAGLQENDIHARSYVDKEENEFVPERDQICYDRMPDYNFGSLDALRPQQNNLTTSMVSCSGSNNFRSKQESMSLEGEVDAENRARISQMSPEEIAKAQAEIMEKLNPGLLKVLQKRGQAKLKKQNLKSEVVSGSEPVNQHVQNTQDAKLLHTEDDISHMVMKPTSENKLDDSKNRTKNLTSASSSSWNAWSNRVEAVRELRFSLAGDVVDTDGVSVYGMPYLFFLCSLAVRMVSVVT